MPAMGEERKAAMADETETTTETTEEAPDLQAELERMRAALAKANKSDEARRKRIEAFEAAEAERAKAAMTETEKLKAEKEAADKRAADAEERARQTLIRAAFVAEAAKAGAAHPEDVYLLADRSAVSVDDAGHVDGVSEAVKALVDAGRIPLAGRTQAPGLDGGAGGNGDRGHGQVKLTALEQQMAKSMGLSPEVYAKQKAAIAARSD